MFSSSVYVYLEVFYFSENAVIRSTLVDDHCFSIIITHFSMNFRMACQYQKLHTSSMGAALGPMSPYMWPTQQSEICHVLLIQCTYYLNHSVQVIS